MSLVLVVSVFSSRSNAQVGPSFDPLEYDCNRLGYGNLDECKSALVECKSLGIDPLQCNAETIIAKKQTQETPTTVETTLGETLDWGTIGLVIVAVVAIAAVAIVALVIKRPIASK